jgi:hypothetical protein
VSKARGFTEDEAWLEGPPVVRSNLIGWKTLSPSNQVGIHIYKPDDMTWEDFDALIDEHFGPIDRDARQA